VGRDEKRRRLIGNFWGREVINGEREREARESQKEEGGWIN
jgi:hypothetical protein